MKRVGFIGPAAGAGNEADVLQRATEFLLGEAEADIVVYLGVDETAERLAESVADACVGGDDETFFGRAAEVALNGGPDEIDALLEAQHRFEQMGRVRVLPEPPDRAIEMLDDRILVMVHDKAVLDEEDILNASVIVFGRAKAAVLKRFGPRYFFSPGPLRESAVGLLCAERDGQVSASALKLDGSLVWREVLQWRTSKMMVQQIGRAHV